MRVTKCFCGGDLGDKRKEGYAICENCGSFVCLEEPPNFEDYYSFGDYWHGQQIEYGFPCIEKRANNDFQDRIPFWFNHIPAGTLSVLEIGCAHGGFLKYCKDQGIPIVLGVEPDPETCRFAKERFDVTVLPGIFPNVKIGASFDVVCAFDVMEHYSDPLAFVEGMASLGKSFLVQVPTGDPRHMKAQEHLFLFSRMGLSWLMDKAKIHIEYVKPSIFAGDFLLYGRKG